MAQNDDRRGRAWRRVRGQERVCEGERESGVDLVGIDHLAMTSRQHSRPVRAVRPRRGRLNAQWRGHEPSETEYDRAGKAAEKASARRHINRVLASIDHLLLHLTRPEVRLPTAWCPA